MDFAQRAARNEEIFRGVNDRIEEGAEKYGTDACQPFHCECGRGMCFGTIEIEPHQYQQIAAERYRFLVIPGHEDAQIERVVERRGHFSIVEKIGEAREQIDHDHPQQRHSN